MIRYCLAFIFSTLILGCASTQSESVVEEVVVSYDKDTLLGTWNCQSPDEQFDKMFQLDATTTFLADGKLSGHALMSGRIPDFDGDINIEIDIAGRWKLEKNKLKQVIDKFEATPLNNDSKFFAYNLRKDVRTGSWTEYTIAELTDSLLLKIQPNQEQQTCTK
ncbi:hypothetical protein AB2S62_08285 [Vibrio sp. NTOU-M3]|uniref:hypothetical protein n=1 Tax=Vibrio sp. NTOU-M3 TaxID=3234954 RepID=UPI00349F15A4